MGNSSLRDLFEIEELEPESLEHSTAAVDAYNWLYKYVTTTIQFRDEAAYTATDGVELPNLIGAVQGLKRFYEYDITPVFVFDGAPHRLKEEELEERAERRREAEEKAAQEAESGNTEKARAYKARSQTLTFEMLETTKAVLEQMGLPYMTAPRSGEAQAAVMAKERDCDYVISDDYDAIVLGSPATLRNFTSSSRSLEGIYLRDTLSKHEITREQLIDIALLCGTDFNDGISGYGPKRSLNGITEYGDISTLASEEDVSLDERIETVRQIYTDPETTDDYPQPVQRTPDVDSVRQFIRDRGIAVSEVESSLSSIEELAA